ncbi:hypothetical protein ES332_D07G170300v1 [Gossypium tomentosum]|uniref:Uncharacterized protein n=1 Tax=Gossypium tomentosum TaxID=34277 RepID=A0A5D2KAT8_GOSTO|nr:hypothetical protein ES332_D07G170300v1 [Gossypium tomentosum]
MIGSSRPAIFLHIQPRAAMATFQKTVSGNWVVVANNLGLVNGYAKNKIKLIHEACCNVMNITNHYP